MYLPSIWTLKYPENKQAGIREGNKGRELSARACGPTLSPPHHLSHLWHHVREGTESMDRRGLTSLQQSHHHRPGSGCISTCQPSFQGLSHYQNRHFSSLALFQLKGGERRRNKKRKGRRKKRVDMWKKREEKEGSRALTYSHQHLQACVISPRTYYPKITAQVTSLVLGTKCPLIMDSFAI